MTKYLEPSFSSGANSQEFREGWERIFGKKTKVKGISEEFVHQDGCPQKYGDDDPCTCCIHVDDS